MNVYEVYAILTLLRLNFPLLSMISIHSIIYLAIVILNLAMLSQCDEIHALPFIKMKLESPFLTSSTTERLDYPNTKSQISFSNNDILYLNLQFDSIPVKTVLEKHYDNAFITLVSGTRQYSFQANSDIKENALVTKLEASQIPSGQYTMYSYLFMTEQKSVPILWKLCQVEIHSSIPSPDNPSYILDASSPNLWKDSTIILPEVTPTDPQKSFPKATIWSPIFVILLILFPWTVLFIFWTRLGLSISSKYQRAPLSGLAFFISITSVFSVIVLNWLYLDLFNTLKILSILVTITCLTGAIHFHSLMISSVFAKK